MTKLTSVTSTLALVLVMACGGGSNESDAGETPDASTIDSSTVDGSESPDAPVTIDAALPDAGPSPSITNINPASGIVTSLFTITGVGFGAAQGTVQMGGVDCTIDSWSTTTIEARVPDLYPGLRDVTVTNAAGTSDPEAFRVVLPAMVYINGGANNAEGFNTVSMFTFDFATGALTEIGDSPLSLDAPAAAGGGCLSTLLVHVPTRRVFASNNNSIAVLDIHPVTGALGHVAGSPFPAGGGGAAGLDITADGSRLFVALFSHGVGVYDVAPDGALTPVAGSPFAATYPDTLVQSEDEAFLYVNDEDVPSGLNAYSVNPTTGALTPLAGSPYSNGDFSYSIERRPGYNQLYVPDHDVGLIVYAHDVGTGIPSLITSSPFAIGASWPDGMAFTQDAQRLYLGQDGSNELMGFALAADGTPTPLPGSPWDLTGEVTEATCFEVSGTGQYLIVLDEEAAEVGVFTLDGDGNPTAVENSPFAMIHTSADPSGFDITF